jgi:hypothetical protein
MNPVKNKSARKDAIKKAYTTSKTPTTTKTRRVTQKENKEINTTDKAVKRKSAIQIHNLKG